MGHKERARARRRKTKAAKAKAVKERRRQVATLEKRVQLQADDAESVPLLAETLYGDVDGEDSTVSKAKRLLNLSLDTSDFEGIESTRKLLIELAKLELAVLKVREPQAPKVHIHGQLKDINEAAAALAEEYGDRDAAQVLRSRAARGTVSQDVVRVDAGPERPAT